MRCVAIPLIETLPYTARYGTPYPAQDTGVASIVSGLVVASAQVMIGSSLNTPDTTSIPEASICQKPSSNFVHLVAEWRQELLSKPRNSTIRIFPFTLDE